MAMEQETVQEHKQTMKKALEALNQKDEQTFKRLHVPDVVVRDFLGEVRGIDALWKHEMDAFDKMQIQRLEMDEMIAEGDTVAMRWHADPVQEGERIRFNLIGTFRFEGDKVKEVWIQGNPAP